MKKLLSAILALTLVSCISTRITASWVNPKQPQRSYSTIFVAAFSGNAIAKSTIENQVAECLNKGGIRTLKSMDEFPPTFLNDTIDRKALIEKVAETHIESILIINIIKHECDYRYAPGPVIYRPDQHKHNGHVNDYYNYWHSCVYGPGYYMPSEIYFLESNLYDAKTQELVWSAQSKSYNPINLNTFARDYAVKMIERLKKDKVLKPIHPSGNTKV